MSHHKEEGRLVESQDAVGVKTGSPGTVLRPSQLTGAEPVNFAVVLPGLYRSGYPKAADYQFMRSLELKTIVTLVGKDLPEGYQQFIDSNRIRHEVFDMTGTKKAEIPVGTMRSIISIVSDRKNYPLLVHCNKGKHRTGCVVGVLRKVDEWDIAAIIKEYVRYAEPKVRETDVQYITDFEVSNLPKAASRPSRASYVTRTLYGMMMMAVSFTLSVWVYSGTRLLMLTTA